MTPPRRKKWTESEEKTLIEKYGEMVSDGTLAKMKTREKKFKPIALHLNSVHHARDPMAYPWQWTWKDVSTKVQNMRHQYLLVKQKIKKHKLLSGDNLAQDGNRDDDEYDWMEGLTHWSNFLRYKETFGDVVALCNGANDSVALVNDDRDTGGGFSGGGGREMEIVEFGDMGHAGDGDFTAGIDGDENGMLGLGFEYDGEDGEENYNVSNQVKEDGDDAFVYEEVDPNRSSSRKKRKLWKGMEKKMWNFLAKQVGKLKEMEVQFEQRDLEREKERLSRENLQMERELERKRKLEADEEEREQKERIREKLRRKRLEELEALEKETEEREMKRKEEELILDREWEERINRRRTEWKKRIDDMLSQHRVEMNQIQTRILHEQQNLANQLLGIVSQWTAQPAGISDHTAANNHYLSQMMQSLHHVNGMVHGDSRVDGDNQDDQFIVDG